MYFPTDYITILDRITQINAVEYARTRNFLDGAVTYLSPYISRGVISLPMVKDTILKKHTVQEAEKLIQELAWRAYWQQVWQQVGDTITNDLKQPQQDVVQHKMISNIENATTGIHAIDKGIKQLYKTGYMHNHCRMYTASLACNIAKAHWLIPSKWMYYHLLDGDIASNSLSWQWVAGTFSSKKYYCNQENINKYTYDTQQNSFLDTSYEALIQLEIPTTLQETSNSILHTNLPQTTIPNIEKDLPTLVYNSYNLDPLWHNDIAANRILLLEPSHFAKYPVSNKVLDFILNLAKNIKDIQIVVAEFAELEQWAAKETIVYKQHPAFMHYRGTAENKDMLFPEVTGMFHSFFSYWKQCIKYL
jgi:deoxyribodipyrimidine photo-lyase